MFEAIEPREAIPLEDAQPFNCRRNARRDVRQTKGQDYSATIEAHDPCCGDDGPCC